MALREVISIVVLAALARFSVGEVSQATSSSVFVDCLQKWGRNLKKYTNIGMSDETIEWECMQSYLWQTASERQAPRNLTSEQRALLKSLVGTGRITDVSKVTEDRVPSSRQPTTPPLFVFPFRKQTIRATRRPTFSFNPFGAKIVQRVSSSATSRRTKRGAGLNVRKEYRALTDAERKSFHKALNDAKNSPLLPPNAYDFVASLHNGVFAQGAHGGPAFLGWHRIYLILMENLLRHFDSSVCLPYWDSSLDNELGDPTQSIMWHSEFAGSGFGFVQNGPFSSWQTLGGIPISRNIGGGSLMTLSNINNVLSRRLLSEISRPTAFPQYDLESHHGGVHGWVGGDMGDLPTATNDPVFFMHHAFIDCIWERFRNAQPGKGVNPNTDYPNTFQANHQPWNSIYLVPSIRNQDTVGQLYASAATCRWPQCPQCGSHYLRCIRGRCVPIISNEAPPCRTCQGDNPGGYAGYQNTYCVNGYCDTSEWAYMPVQITYNRPPDYGRSTSYGSYPVVRGKPQYRYDIYNPRGYNQRSTYKNRYQQQNRSPRYTNCGCRRNGANSGQVYVQSYGMNYNGNYRESAVVDRRYAISSNVAYVAVRNPRYQATQAYVSVYDDCGRVCRPTCWNSSRRRWLPCTGTIRMTTRGGNRRGYGNSYEEATYQIWDYGVGGNEAYPTYSQDNIYLNYFCDYSRTLPWENYRG